MTAALRTDLQADLERLQEQAGEAARLLRLIGNENRLLILCLLAGGEMTVGALNAAVPLSQSALSQHLAKMREDGLVAARKDGLNVRYRVADGRAERILFTLKGIFCP
ncbi:MAG: helix-turn-helix transcriptional regulator [Maricaulaceae bacterium]|nr:helix-turn-helix transcriptional regulator [Maricaulaceae bacterium]